MITIVLPTGHLAFVDGDRLALIALHRWQYDRGYVKRAERRGGRTKWIYLHRAVLGLDEHDRRDVDHINGNRLDNRQANLRACSRTQNCANRPRDSDGTAGFKGVTRRKQASRVRYIAQIQHRGRRHYLGIHDTAEAAAMAYDAKAIDLFGEFARLNFPKT